MKSNLFSLLLLLCIFTLPAFGQKLRDKVVGINYVSLPSKQLPAEYTTYSVSTYGASMSIAGLNPNKVNASIKMNGFKRLSGLENNYGHLRIKLNTGYVTTNNVELKHKTNTYTNKDGKEVTTTSY